MRSWGEAITTEGREGTDRLDQTVTQSSDFQHQRELQTQRELNSKAAKISAKAELSRQHSSR